MKIPERWFSLKFTPWRGKTAGSAPFDANYPDEVMSIRVRNILSRSGFTTMGQLAEYLVANTGHLPVMRNSGTKALREIEKAFELMHDSPGLIPVADDGATGPYLTGPEVAQETSSAELMAQIKALTPKAAAWDAIILILTMAKQQIEAKQ